MREFEPLQLEIRAPTPARPLVACHWQCLGGGASGLQHAAVPQTTKHRTLWGRLAFTMPKPAEDPAPFKLKLPA